MSEPKRILELDQSIETIEETPGVWVARLPMLGIEERASSHDAAQDGAVAAMLDKLGAMSDGESRTWIEANSSPASADDLPSCSVPQT